MAFMACLASCLLALQRVRWICCIFYDDAAFEIAYGACIANHITNLQNVAAKTTVEWFELSRIWS